MRCTKNLERVNKDEFYKLWELQMWLYEKKAFDILRFGFTILKKIVLICT